MKAYFTRKPMTVEDVKANAAWAKAERQEPVEVPPSLPCPLPRRFRAPYPGAIRRLLQSTPEGLEFSGTLR